MFINFENEKLPIYSVKEMATEFRNMYLSKGDVTTLASIMSARDNGFFRCWIPTNTINSALRTKGTPNKGNALEYILGKKIDNSQFSDLPDAELKSYDENVGYHELFMLSPYNFRYWNPETMENRILRNDSEVNEVLASFKDKMKAKAQSKWINTDEYTNYETISNKAFAKVIIDINKAGESVLRGFDIETEFFGVDENGLAYSLGFIISRYSAEDAETELMYRGKRGVLKQTLSQAINNKIFTILSIPTRSLYIKNKGATNYRVLPNDRRIYNEFYQYTNPEIHRIKIRDRKDLVLNFIEAINNRDVIVSFGFDDNLHMKAKFVIKNSQEAYDKLYKSDEDMKIFYMGDTEVPGDQSRIEPVWTNHNCMASQNSIDLDYEYEGELWGDEGTGAHAYVVNRSKFQDNDESFEEVYNVENEDEQLVFPVWFDDFEPYKDPNGCSDGALLVGLFGGNRYLLNWVTGEMRKM